MSYDSHNFNLHKTQQEKHSDNTHSDNHHSENTSSHSPRQQTTPHSQHSPSQTSPTSSESTPPHSAHYSIHSQYQSSSGVYHQYPNREQFSGVNPSYYAQHIQNNQQQHQMHHQSGAGGHGHHGHQHHQMHHQQPSDYDNDSSNPQSSTNSDENTANYNENDSDEDTATSARRDEDDPLEKEDEENDEITIEREHVRTLLNRTNRTGLVPGLYYYLLETNWWRNWCGYVAYNNYQRVYRFQHSPGPIDNSGLVDESGEVKRTKIEDTDYVFVPKDVWEYIIGRYGGGPPLPRLCVKGTRSPATVEVRKLPVKVIWSRKPKEQLPAFFSKGTTIGQFLDEMSKKIKFDRANIRVYDFHNGSKIRLLDDMNTIFSDVPIVENQPILIEQRTKQGLWPNEKIYSRYNHFQPMRYPPSPPGKTGLQNLGNTCFMASSIQCLSQTVPLVDYFLTRNFIQDINRTNPLGQKGELAEQYFDLLKDLWSASTSVIEPRLFKKAIERCDQRFAGYQQHDSQELLIFLLDGIHEDLNRVKNKPYVEKAEGDGTKDEECANAAWTGHKARNNSIVVDNFQGLLKSTLTCPINGRVSTTFDPFMYLTVPIPIQSTRKIPVILYRIHKGRKPMKYGITVDKEGTIADLVKELSKLSSIPPENLAILEVYGYKFYKHFTDKDELSDIRETDKIYAYEIKVSKKIPKITKIERAPVPDIPSPRSEREGAETTETTNTYEPPAGVQTTVTTVISYPAAGGASSSTEEEEEEEEEEIYHLPVQWKKLDGYSSSFFGVPFILSVPKTVNYTQLYSSLIDSISYYLTQSPTVTSSESDDDSDAEGGVGGEDGKRLKTFFQITKQPTGYEYGYDPHPYHHHAHHHPQKEEKTLVKNKQTIIMEWTKQHYKDYYNQANENMYDIHPSLNSSTNDENSEISLHDCLMAFTKQEQLGPDDPWYCTDCKEFRQAYKKFDIWSAPPILIIHLKRFSYRGRFSFREKLDNLISFPLTDLDLSQFIIGPSPVPPIYDLYAISNHFGSLGGGHYTAYCKHRDDGQWYQFDDSSVRVVPASQVLSSAAYVLFYHRKDIAWPEFDRSLDRIVPEEEEGSDTEEESSDHSPENNTDAPAPDQTADSTNPFDNLTPNESTNQIANPSYVPPAGFEPDVENNPHHPSESQQLKEESKNNPPAGEKVNEEKRKEDQDIKVDQASIEKKENQQSEIKAEEEHLERSLEKMTLQENTTSPLPAGTESPQKESMDI